MTNLNQHLQEHIKKVPERLLRRTLREKLKEQDVDDDALLEALMDHIISGNCEPFHWDDGQRGLTKKLDIEFTDEDAKKLEDDFNGFFKEKLPDVILNTVRASAKSLVKELERQWPEQRVDEHNSMGHFRDHLRLRWAKGLDPLHMMLVASREVGEEFADKLSRSRAKKGITKREALLVLHMRACLTTMEILTLLENGLSDGAYARWRTLYEISVVAMAIDRFGDEMSERYLSHDVVSLREFNVNEYKHEGKNYDAARLKGEVKEIEDEFQAALHEYGRSFGGPYGWAAFSLDKKSPRLQDLEEAIEWSALPPSYKLSSFKVHAGVAGTVRSFATVGGQSFVPTGASNAGLETPATYTAFSLMQITSLVFTNPGALETQIKMAALTLLRDKVVRECRKAAKILEEDDVVFRESLTEE